MFTEKKENKSDFIKWILLNEFNIYVYYKYIKYIFIFVGNNLSTF